jgi:hypothetical protein
MKVTTLLVFFLFANWTWGIPGFNDTSLTLITPDRAHGSARTQGDFEHLNFNQLNESKDKSTLFNDLDNWKFVSNLNWVSSRDLDFEETKISELDFGSFFSGSLRMQIEDKGIYRYLSPAYTVNGGNTGWLSTTETNQYRDYGVGIGSGYKFSNRFLGELNFEFYEETVILGISGKFMF